METAACIYFNGRIGKILPDGRLLWQETENELPSRPCLYFGLPYMLCLIVCPLTVPNSTLKSFGGNAVNIGVISIESMIVNHPATMHPLYSMHTDYNTSGISVKSV
jgi:hypothetical protein